VRRCHKQWGKGEDHFNGWSNHVSPAHTILAAFHKERRQEAQWAERKTCPECNSRAISRGAEATIIQKSGWKAEARSIYCYRCYNFGKDWNNPVMSG